MFFFSSSGSLLQDAQKNPASLLPNIKFKTPEKILPELFYSSSFHADHQGLSAVAPGLSSWLMHLQCSKENHNNLKSCSSFTFYI